MIGFSPFERIPIQGADQYQDPRPGTVQRTIRRVTMVDFYEQVRNEAALVALREEAKGVYEVGSQNRGPEIDVYKKRAHSPKSKNHEWCGFFVYYCLSEAASKYAVSLPFIPEKLWSGYKLTKWANGNPYCIVRERPCYPGDIYVMNNGHIGIVIDHDFGDIVNTVDGNQSQVGRGRSLIRRTRNIADMRVVIRI